MDNAVRWTRLAVGLMLLTAGGAWAQDQAEPPATDTRWRPPNETAGLQPVNGQARRSITQVKQGIDALPNEQGQVWREYDISPYTLRITNTARPEQAIVDWVLRETGYEPWHNEPLGILCAGPKSLKVYHTPEMHAKVIDVVDRFVNTSAASHGFGLRVVSIGNPNWRARAVSVLRPVSVQTQGIQAWLVQKEDAALLLADLRRRMDFQEHASPHLVVHNGQSTTVAMSRPRSYVRNIVPRQEMWPAFEPDLAQIDEGFAIELSPLMSIDGTTVDAVIKCHIDQVEKLNSVVLDLPAAGPNQRTKIEVPQVVQSRLHERFRWPVDQVLVVSLGVVAMPALNDNNPLKSIPIPLPLGAARAELLLFVDSKGEVAGAAAAGRPAGPDTSNYHGRY